MFLVCTRFKIECTQSIYILYIYYIVGIITHIGICSYTLVPNALCAAVDVSALGDSSDIESVLKIKPK